MSLPLLHAGRTNPGLSAALDLRFALDKSLTAYRGPTPSFSRASTGTYFNASGVLTSAAINAPRFNHTYNGTSWVSRGLLVEEQRTNLILYSNDLTNAAWNTIGNLTPTSNAAISPEGLTNANQIMETTANSTHFALQAYAKTSATYTLSAFVKPNGRDRIYLDLNVGSTDYIGYFDLTAKTYLGNGGYSNVDSYSITDVGNGWVRVSITKTTNLSNYGIFLSNGIGISYSGDATKGIYIYGVQLETGSFPTSYTPTTSASTTRSADVCQITGTDFSGFWNGTEGTIVGDFDRLFIPTGTASALYTARDSSNNNAIYYYIDVSKDVSQVYASGASATFDFGSPVGAGISNKIATAYKANDFAASRNGSTPLTDTSGAVPSGQTLMEIGSTVSANYLNGHIARLRYFNKRLPNATLQLLSEPDPTLNLQFALNKTLTPVAGPAPSFSRASAGTYFNASGILTSASINTPRFDHVYSGGQWVSRGLLVEEQRTNLILQSSSLSTLPWSNTDYTITSETSPDGTSNAQKLVAPASNASRRIEQAVTGTAASYSLSFYAKSAGWNFVQICYGWNSDYVNFDLANGVISNSLGSTVGSIQNIGNGWYRCIGTFTAGASTQGIRIIPMATSVASRFPNTTGDGINGILVFGVQFELGAFPTSYIGTTSSAVVRSADVCQITGTSFNWMWNQGEGSVVSTFDRIDVATQSPFIWDASGTGGSNNNAIMFTPRSSGSMYWVFNGGSPQVDMSLGNQDSSFNQSSAAVAYKLNDFAGSLNGASVLTDTLGTIPTTTKLDFGFSTDYPNAPFRLNGHIAKLVYYPARLTNTKLQQLST